MLGIRDNVKIVWFSAHSRMHVLKTVAPGLKKEDTYPMPNVFTGHLRTLQWTIGGLYAEFLQINTWAGARACLEIDASRQGLLAIHYYYQI